MNHDRIPTQHRHDENTQPRFRTRHRMTEGTPLPSAYAPSEAEEEIVYLGKNLRNRRRSSELRSERRKYSSDDSSRSLCLHNSILCLHGTLLEVAVCIETLRVLET